MVVVVVVECQVRNRQKKEARMHESEMAQLLRFVLTQQCLTFAKH